MVILVLYTTFPYLIICIFEITNIITAFCETDSYDECMMEFLITPSQEALTTITEHLHIQMTPEQALPVVLQHQMQSQDWSSKLNSHKNFSKLVESMMQILSEFELLDWTEITDKHFLEQHTLKNLYSSFIPFTDAALNVYDFIDTNLTLFSIRNRGNFMKHTLRKKIFEFQDEHLQDCRSGILSDVIQKKVSSKIFFDVMLRFGLAMAFAILELFWLFRQDTVLSQTSMSVYLLFHALLFFVWLMFVIDGLRSFRNYSSISTLKIVSMDVSMSEMIYGYSGSSSSANTYFLQVQNLKFFPIGYLPTKDNLSPLEQLFDGSKRYRLYYISTPLMLLSIDELESSRPHLSNNTEEHDLQ